MTVLGVCLLLCVGFWVSLFAGHQMVSLGFFAGINLYLWCQFRKDLKRMKEEDRA